MSVNGSNRGLRHGCWSSSARWVSQVARPSVALEIDAAAKVLVWCEVASFTAELESNLWRAVPQWESALSSAQPGVPADRLRRPLN
jgi:hypothetical protein